MFYTEVEIPSDLNKISEIEDFAESVMQDCGIGESQKAIIVLPLIEATKNAIVHGNGNHFEKSVRILCQEDSHKITFSVSDQGNGFPFQEVYEEAIADCTHGLSVIKALCDRVCFQRNGATIVFEINTENRMLRPVNRNLSQKVFEKMALQTY